IDSARLSKRFHRIAGLRSHHLYPLHLALSIGINTNLQRHAEQIEVLRNLTYDAETLTLPTLAVNRVLVGEFRSARPIEPLRKERGELRVGDLLGQRAELFAIHRFACVLRR